MLRLSPYTRLLEKLGEKIKSEKNESFREKENTEKIKLKKTDFQKK